MDGGRGDGTGAVTYDASPANCIGLVFRGSTYVLRDAAMVDDKLVLEVFPDISIMNG